MKLPTSKKYEIGAVNSHAEGVPSLQLRPNAIESGSVSANIGLDRQLSAPVWPWSRCLVLASDDTSQEVYLAFPHSVWQKASDPFISRACHGSSTQRALFRLAFESLPAEGKPLSQAAGSNWQRSPCRDRWNEESFVSWNERKGAELPRGRRMACCGQELGSERPHPSHRAASRNFRGGHEEQRQRHLCSMQHHAASSRCNHRIAKPPTSFNRSSKTGQRCQSLHSRTIDDCQDGVLGHKTCEQGKTPKRLPASQKQERSLGMDSPSPAAQGAANFGACTVHRYIALRSHPQSPPMKARPCNYSSNNSHRVATARSAAGLGPFSSVPSGRHSLLSPTRSIATEEGEPESPK